MNAGIIKNILLKGKGFVLNNSAAICTGAGIAATVSIPFFAVSATPKALLLIEEAKEDKGVEELTPVEIIQTTWKVYIPTALSTAMAIGLFVAAFKASEAQRTALASAYSLAERTLDKYQEKVIEIIGEEKDDKIREEIAQDILEEGRNESIIPFGSGTELCYDGISGRYFNSDIESVREAMNDFNFQLNEDYYRDLNDWYMVLGLPQIQMGEILGWNSDRLMDIHFTSTIAANGKPCVVLDYSKALPSPFYRR